MKDDPFRPMFPAYPTLQNLQNKLDHLFGCLAADGGEDYRTCPWQASMATQRASSLHTLVCPAPEISNRQHWTPECTFEETLWSFTFSLFVS